MLHNYYHMKLFAKLTLRAYYVPGTVLDMQHVLHLFLLTTLGDINSCPDFINWKTKGHQVPGHYIHATHGDVESDHSLCDSRPSMHGNLI